MKYELLVFCILWALVSVFSKKDDHALVKDLANANQNFIRDLWRKYFRYENTSNVVFSPLSAELILSLLAEGARGETKKELLASGYVPTGRGDAFAVYLGRLHSLEGKTLYNSASRIFLRNDLFLNEDFAKIAKYSYKTTVQNVNFFNRTGAASEINKWSHYQKYQQGPDIVDAQLLHWSTNIVIASTVYLQVTWQKSFRRRIGIFYNKDTSRVMVPMLTRRGTYGFYENTLLNIKFLEVPIVDIAYHHEEPARRLSMVFVLPSNQKEPTNLAMNMFAPVPFVNMTVSVTIPKFKIETVLDFKDVFSQLGIKNIFDEKHADLTTWAGHTYRRHYITNIIQKNFLSIDRYGAEVGTDTALVAPTRRSYEIFKANRPFLYYIQREGVIIVAGEVSELY